MSFCGPVVGAHGCADADSNKYSYADSHRFSHQCSIGVTHSCSYTGSNLSSNFNTVLSTHYDANKYSQFQPDCDPKLCPNIHAHRGANWVSDVDSYWCAHGCADCFPYRQPGPKQRSFCSAVC
jgi:hypothetical protein